MREVRIGSAKFAVTDENAAFWDRAASGHWEPATFEAIGANLTPETTVLDFGAWIGPVTLFAASLARRVISFEPDPEAARQLKANIALNPALAGKITVIEKAVWPTPGTLKLGAKKAQGDSMSSVHHTGSDVTWEVETITPGEIAALIDRGPVFLKIDTEGAEYSIVPQLTNLAARTDLSALVSFHPRFAAGGHPRFHKTFPMTKRVFEVFRGYKVWRVHHKAVTRAVLPEMLLNLGLPYFEAKTTYLFKRG